MLFVYFLIDIDSLDMQYFLPANQNVHLTTQQAKICVMSQPCLHTLI